MTIKKLALILAGAALLIFGLTDIIRLAHSKINLFFFTKKTGVYKEKEQRKFSSMTLFLLSSFLIMLIFSHPIAVTAMIFLIFGDMFSKFFGIQYGRVKLFGKSLEGSIAYFIACFVAGYFLLAFLPSLSLGIIICGAAAATLAEMMPLGVDDNLSAGVIAAAAMFLVQKLF